MNEILGSLILLEFGLGLLFFIIGLCVVIHYKYHYKYQDIQRLKRETKHPMEQSTDNEHKE